MAYNYPKNEYNSIKTVVTLSSKTLRMVRDNN